MLFFFKALTLASFFLFSNVNASAATACPANLSLDAWEQLTPYFLPEDHPAKKILDKIFSSTKVLKNDKTLKKAGFKTYGIKGHSKTKVLKHKKLKKYLIKAFTDDQPQTEWQSWMRRVEGSFAIQTAIDDHSFNHIFKVPQKWIYQVSRKQESFDEKNFVLLVEDMEIFDQRGNNILYGTGGYVTANMLTALYIILSEVGLNDSIYTDNIPFSLDGKITFIDTEHFHNWPVRFDYLTHHFTPKMQIHWTNLISDAEKITSDFR